MFPGSPPPDLHPVASDDLKRAHDEDYARTLERRRLERLVPGNGNAGSVARLRVLAWTLGAAVIGFLGVAVPFAVFRLDALVSWVVLLLVGLVVGAVAAGRAGRWPLLGFAIGAASVGPVYLLVGLIPFPGDAWWVVAALNALIASAGFVLGGWLRAVRGS